MTLNPGWFLNATGQFLPVAGASTSTSTSMFTVVTKATTVDITLNTTSGAYIDGPSVAQGSSGIWFVTGTLSLQGSGSDNMFFKLWDGTTVINSVGTSNAGAGFFTSVTLSGVMASPAGNLRISGIGGATTTIKFNISGNSQDSNITAIRIG